MVAEIIGTFSRITLSTLVVSRNSANSTNNLLEQKTNDLTFLMPFSKCSQYPVVGRISANGIRNYDSDRYLYDFKTLLTLKTLKTL